VGANFEEKNWHPKNFGNFLLNNYEKKISTDKIFLVIFFILEKLVFENLFF